MAFRPSDVTGERYGRLVALARTERRGHKWLWTFACDCGNTVIGFPSIMRRNCRNYNGRVSCGCLRRELAAKNIGGVETHGMSRTPEYTAFRAAKERCKNPNNPGYKGYGAQGVEFRFSSFEEFISAVGRRPSKDYSLDRIDVYGHYESSNVRWSLATTQQKNKRPYVAKRAISRSDAFAFAAAPLSFGA